MNYKTTTKSADWFSFRKQVVNFGYDFAQAFYRLVDRAAGSPRCRYLFGAIETYPPYEGAVYELSEAWMDGAEARARRAIQQWDACCRSGVWEGYPRGLHEMDPPDWLADKFAEEVDR
jgi:hypothetical protein